MDNFKLFTVSQNAGDIREAEGAVPKLWVQTSEGKALFKIADINDYDPEKRSDWPEKVASELADRLNLPTARYEFAQLEVKGSNVPIPGTISFKLSNYGGEREALEKVLERTINNYNFGTNYSVSSVIDILERQNVQLPPNSSLPNGINDGADMFVGALMLDAYTCNIDRHARNFDIISSEDEDLKVLSPIFDYGRSLGFYLADEVKEERSIPDYSQSVQSYITVDGYKKNGFEVFAEAARLRPQAAQIWQNELSQINTLTVQELFNRIPEGIVTPITEKFAIDLLEHNQREILNLKIELSPSQIQQQHVEKVAPILLKYLEYHQQLRAENGDAVIEIDPESKTLSYFQRGNSSEYLKAKFENNRWQNLGTQINPKRIKEFEKMAKILDRQPKLKPEKKLYPRPRLS